MKRFLEKTNLSMWKKLLILFAFSILAIILLMELKSNYKESYRIQSVDLEVFSINRRDSSNGCYYISKVKDSSNSLSSDLLIGLRFRVKYLDQHREHLFETFGTQKVDGGKGHIDTIAKISFYLSTNFKENINNFLEDASKYNNYKIEGEISNNQSLNSWTHCNVAQTFISIDSLIAFYNQENKKVSILNDVIFFKVSDIKIVRELRENLPLIEIRFLPQTGAGL